MSSQLQREGSAAKQRAGQRARDAVALPEYKLDDAVLIPARHALNPIRAQLF
jgi:hypothetical protein